MDRLSSVNIICGFLLMSSLTACGKESADTQAGLPPARVVAVQAKGDGTVPLSEFCDVMANPAAPRALRLPELDQPPSVRPGARWVNVWATWCKPCIKEMPMLAQWQTKLNQTGVPMSLDFLSVDEEVPTLTAFMASHREIPSTLHLKVPDTLPAWLTELGLDSGAGLPIHIFADATGTIRCIRAAAIEEIHYATIAKLLK